MMLDKMYTIMDAACKWGNKNLGTSIPSLNQQKNLWCPVPFQVVFLLVQC